MSAAPRIGIGALAFASALTAVATPAFAAPDAAPQPLVADKAGPFMLNVKGGIGVGVDQIGPTTGYLRMESQWALGIDAGWAAFGDGNGYLVIAPQMQKGAISTIRTLTGGVQYDIPITLITKNLYLYPRMTIGYSFLEQEHATAHSFTMIFEAGLKYVASRRVNFGIEPVSWALYQIGDRFGESKWRFSGYGGVNF